LSGAEVPLVIFSDKEQTEIEAAYQSLHNHLTVDIGLIFDSENFLLSIGAVTAHNLERTSLTLA